MSNLSPRPNSYVIPNKNISLPIRYGDDLIRFSIFEAGCCIAHKDRQVKGIIKTLNEYNKQGFYIESPIYPNIVVFGTARRNYSSKYTFFKVTDFPDWTMDYLRQKLDSTKLNELRIKLHPRELKYIDEFLENDDLSMVHDLLFEKEYREDYCNLRGTIAEYVIQEIVDISSPSEVQVLCNGNLKKFFDNLGVVQKINPEMDVLGIFYKENSYLKHVVNLSRLDYVKLIRPSDSLKDKLNL